MGVIYVGVDGSAPSRAALRWAVAIAPTIDGEVRALGAWQYPARTGTPFGPSSTASPEEMDRRLEDEVRGVLTDELGEAAPSVEIEVARGVPGDALVARSVRPETALIVLGARGLGGFEGMLLGSVTQECVERAACPVVVVRSAESAASTPPSKILIGMDGSDGSARALEWAGEIARGTGGSVVAVHAPGIGMSREYHEEAGRLLDQWTAPLPRAGALASAEIGDGDARDVLLDAADSHDADLIVVGTRGLGAVRRMLVGSVAGHLVRYAERPVAIIPGPDRGR
jgi:nucleotide-binding universal stress UspA family protein